MATGPAGSGSSSPSQLPLAVIPATFLVMFATGGKRAVAVLVPVLFGVLAAVALAHDEGTTSFEGSGNGWCMYGRGAINGEQNKLASTVWSYTEGCGGFKVKDPGKLRTGVKALKQAGDGSYNQCTNAAWQYNSSETYATATVETWGGPVGPCGHGRYKAHGSQGLFNNGDWKDGAVNSPPHMW